MAENRNMGISTIWTQSMCWNVFIQLVTAMPREAKPSATSRAPGIMSSAVQEVTSPATVMTIRKPTA